MAVQAQTKIHRIGLDDASKRLKEIVFVDARSATALSRNPLQVRGAIHVPVKCVKTFCGLAARTVLIEGGAT